MVGNDCQNRWGKLVDSKVCISKGCSCNSLWWQKSYFSLKIKRYLNSWILLKGSAFRQSGGCRESPFLHLLIFKCHQLKIILLPQGHTGDLSLANTVTRSPHLFLTTLLHSCHANEWLSFYGGQESRGWLPNRPHIIWFLVSRTWI